MAKFYVPAERAEKPLVSEDSPFPAGLWRGIIEEVRVRDVVRGGDGPQFLFNNVAGVDTATIASIQLGSITPLVDGQPDVGNRKFFDDLFVLTFGPYRWDEPAQDEPSWRLDQTRNRLTNLARALGAAEADGEGNIGPVDTFHDMLVDGALQGLPVAFEVVHRKRGNNIFPTLKAYLPLP